MKEENKALQRLLSGYAEFASQDEADCLWKPYVKAGMDWIGYCKRSIEVSKLKNTQKRLWFWDKAPCYGGDTLLYTNLSAYST